MVKIMKYNQRLSLGKKNPFFAKTSLVNQVKKGLSKSN
ncbi:hypothetical protein VIBHAR_06824 [Vibrio campbellii ATCC BAA-1116]|uniref:Uncharacterized protein n=1 Tax=Vibrio campbellii (strain ATCC BAA-1116) TaxID=2902295 RepID=A7N7U6_VIBC1|nr:hypothetical protein VIBHAR_06824 [Vibrio campbellii ATCC BAA-1116]